MLSQLQITVFRLPLDSTPKNRRTLAIWMTNGAGTHVQLNWLAEGGNHQVSRLKKLQLFTAILFTVLKSLFQNILKLWLSILNSKIDHSSCRDQIKKNDVFLKVQRPIFQTPFFQLRLQLQIPPLRAATGPSPPGVAERLPRGRGRESGLCWVQLHSSRLGRWGPHGGKLEHFAWVILLLQPFFWVFEVIFFWSFDFKVDLEKSETDVKCVVKTPVNQLTSLT